MVTITDTLRREAAHLQTDSSQVDLAAVQRTTRILVQHTEVNLLMSRGQTDDSSCVSLVDRMSRNK